MHGSLARVNTTRRHKASRKTRNQRPITLTRGWICFLKHPSVNKFERLCCEHRCRHAAQLSRQKSRCFTTALATAHHLPQLPLDTMLLIFWRHLFTFPACWFDAIHLRPTLSWSVLPLLISTSRKHIGTHQSTTQGQGCQPWHSEFKVVGYTPLAVAKECTMTSLSESPSIGTILSTQEWKNEMTSWLAKLDLIQIPSQSAVKTKNMKNMKWIPKRFSMRVFTKASFK